MKILFYLPVVTPWWFQEIIVPIIRTLHAGTAPVELHVMIAPLWRNTGIESRHLAAAADLTSVQWHVIDEGEPDQFRLAGAEVPGLLELVAAIAPDLTLARSADFAISRQFPGVVRYVMEASASPFAYHRHFVALEEEPFAPAAVPAQAGAQAEVYAECLRRVWPVVEQCRPLDRPTVLRARLGLPADRRVIAVPLLYEHQENYFLRHAAFPEGLVLLERLLADLPEDVVLAIADHPLNRMYGNQPDHPLYVERGPVRDLIARHPGRMVDCTQWRATDMLAICADAMLNDLSKSWTLSAFFGTPLVNISPRPVAGWLQALDGLEALPSALAAGGLRRPDPIAARHWFGWHTGARLVEPQALTLDRLVRCIEQRPSEADVAHNLAMVIGDQQARFAKLKDAA